MTNRYTARTLLDACEPTELPATMAGYDTITWKQVDEHGPAGWPTFLYVGPLADMLRLMQDVYGAESLSEAIDLLDAIEEAH